MDNQKHSADERLQIANGCIHVCKTAFSEAEKHAREVLVGVLKPAGESGVPTCSSDHTDGRVPIAQPEPQKFYPITKIRYWQEKLEVFIANYVPTGQEDLGWQLLEEGRWIPYGEAYTDTWYMLDVIQYNLDYTVEGYRNE